MEGGLRDGAGRPGLKLIETLLWDGAAFPRLALHRARLERSAQALGWRAPPDLAAALGRPGPAPARLRLTCDAAGQIAVSQAALPAAKPLWRLRLHPDRLVAGDPWRAVKSTDRAVYDRARDALPEGQDEWLFANDRGEVCEGTITNVFFDRGQGLRTPPLAVGCLPGVLRAELGVPEEVLRVEDLGRVRLFLGNALRGLAAAKLF